MFSRADSARELNRLEEASLTDSEDELEDDDDELGGFGWAYKVVFALSVLAFAVGALSYLTVSSSNFLSRLLVSLGLLASGLFAMLNSDMIVTYLRMRQQLVCFEANNSAFEEHLQEEAKHVSALSKMAKMLEKLDSEFQGDLGKMGAEMERLTASCASSMKGSIKTLCRMYFDGDNSRTLDLNDELEQAFDLFEEIFSPVYPYMGHRLDGVQAALDKEPRIEEDDCVTIGLLSTLISCAIGTEDVNKVEDECTKIIKAAVEADSDV